MALNKERSSPSGLLKRRTGVVALVAATSVAALTAVVATGADAAARVPLAALTAHASTAKAKAPKEGVLTWGGGLLPTSWDPYHSTAGNDAPALDLVYAGLTSLDPQGDAIPDLATSWKYAKNGLSLTFILRKGVTFTDGTPFNAAAVQYNLVRDMAPSALNSSELATIASVKPHGNYKITLDLKTKDYGLPLRLAGIAGLLVSPAAIQSNPNGLATQPVGAGPFKLTAYVSGSSATVVKNPKYWDAKDIHLSGVNIVQYLDPQTELSAVESGQIKLAEISGTAAAAAKSAGLTVQVVPTLEVSNIEINASIAPLGNRKVIQAINFALNRKALLQAYNGGIGQVDDESFPPGYIGYNGADANMYTYNPKKAKALVQSVGTPISFPITYIDAAPSNTVAELIQSELAAVGIQTTLSSVPSLQWASDVYAQHDIAFTQGYNLGRESPLQLLDVQFGADGLLNPCRCVTPGFTKAYDKALSYRTNAPQYPQALQAATNAALKSSSVAFLFTVPRVFVYKKGAVINWPYDRVEPQVVGVSVK
jgi:ABC-type transport system substrate-binding protein